MQKELKQIANLEKNLNSYVQLKKSWSPFPLATVDTGQKGEPRAIGKPGGDSTGSFLSGSQSGAGEEGELGD